MNAKKTVKKQNGGDHTKNKRRLLSLVLAVVMVLALFPTAAFAHFEEDTIDAEVDARNDPTRRDHTFHIYLGMEKDAYTPEDLATEFGDYAGVEFRYLLDLYYDMYDPSDAALNQKAHDAVFNYVNLAYLVGHFEDKALFDDLAALGVVKQGTDYTVKTNWPAELQQYRPMESKAPDDTCEEAETITVAAIPSIPGHEILTKLPGTLNQPIRPSTLEQAEGLTYDVTDDLEWTLSQSKEDVFQEIVTLTDSLTAGKRTDTEKVKAIYDWVSQNVKYDYTAFKYIDDGYDSEEAEQRVDESADPFCVYAKRMGICDGYAKLCWLMCSIAEIPAAHISGTARGGGKHAWNAAAADGKWLFFDATWSQWDMGPDYHKASRDFVLCDSAFKMSWIYSTNPPFGKYERHLEYRICPGYECPARLVVPEGVTKIGGLSFWNNCTALKSIVLPSTCTIIESPAFCNCPNLESITVLNKSVEIGDGAFSRTAFLKNAKGFAILGTTLLKYQGTDQEISIPAGVTKIGADAFAECKTLIRITIPDSVTKIGDNAFQECTNLREINIPNTVTDIGSYAFYGCKNLAAVNIPGGVTEIRHGTFSNCTSLTSVTIPDGVTEIWQGVFSDCTNLTSVTISDSVTSIGSGAFAGCKRLKNVRIPKKVTQIGSCTFERCTSLMDIIIPDGVTSIEQSAFNGCTGLTNITIPNSVNRIWVRAFSGCSNLTDIFIPSSVTTIWHDAFDGCVGLKNVYFGGTKVQWGKLKTYWSSALSSATIHYNSTIPKRPADTALASTQSVLVDGRDVTVYAYALVDKNGGITNYIKLRDVASLLNGTAAQFEVGWDGAIHIETGKAYTPNGSELVQNFTGNRPYAANGTAVFVNGAEVNLEAIVLTDTNGGNYTYFKLRDLGRTLNFNVSWNGSQIEVNTAEAYSDAA